MLRRQYLGARQGHQPVSIDAVPVEAEGVEQQRLLHRRYEEDTRQEGDAGGFLAEEQVAGQAEP